MVRILDAPVNLEFPLGHHLHCLVAQLPVKLRCSGRTHVIEDGDAQWASFRSVLQLVKGGTQFKKLHFTLFPESCVPAARLDEALALVDACMRPNTVTVFGVEHVHLETYRAILGRHADDNREAIALVQQDLDSGAPPQIPVNWCCVAVKEATGKLRVFLEAKTHPYRGEEFLDKVSDLYRGRHFWCFRSHPACFNFMALICLDYIYRDTYSSNIRQVIDYSNQLFFTTRQTLDALFVVQANPKPEHRAYWEVLTGFYGEYIEQTPGVRETVTVLANSSEESSIDGSEGLGSFGASAIVVGRHHKLVRVEDDEFCTDDFGGAPLCRLRFGRATRIFYFNLPAEHALDPRSSRIPMKVHLILRRAGDQWREELRVPWPTEPPVTSAYR
jgi:hypothetical protein